MEISFFLFSGFKRLCSVPLGSFAKASSVGANTVNGPLLFNLSTNPAALTAATKVRKDLLPAATSTISPVRLRLLSLLCLLLSPPSPPPQSRFLTSISFFWASSLESFPAFTSPAKCLSAARYLSKRGSSLLSSFLSPPPRLAASIRLRSSANILAASSRLISPLFTPSSMRLRLIS